VINVSERFSLSGNLRLQGILPRTVTGSDHDLGNGTYNLVIGAAGGHMKILF
jgi:long-chain fatty acid transport protein